MPITTIEFNETNRTATYNDGHYRYTLIANRDRIMILIQSSSRRIKKAKPINIQIPDEFEYNLDLSACFTDHEYLRDISALSSIDSSKIISTEMMFRNCRNLTDISPLSSWNTINILSMEGMFYDCGKLHRFDPLNSWKISEYCLTNGFIAPYGHRTRNYRMCPMVSIPRQRRNEFILPSWIQEE